MGSACSSSKDEPQKDTQPQVKSVSVEPSPTTYVLDEGINNETDIKVLIRRLKLEYMVADIALQVCARIGKLCSTVDIQATAGNNGIFEALVDVVREHIRRPDLTLQACRLLYLATYLCDSNKELAAQKGCVDMLLSVLQCHDQDKVIVEAAMAAATSIAVNARGREVIGKSGLIEVILAAMQMHKAKESLVAQACWALSGCIASNPDNQSLLEAKGGINIILAALSACPSDDSLAEAACLALHCLALRSKETAVKIYSELGGEEILSRVAKSRPESSRISRVARSIACAATAHDLQNIIVSPPGKDASSYTCDQCGTHPLQYSSGCWHCNRCSSWDICAKCHEQGSAVQ